MLRRAVRAAACWSACGAALAPGPCGPAQAASLYVVSASQGRGGMMEYRIAADGTLQPFAMADVDSELAGLAVDEAGGGNVYVFDPKLPMIGQFTHDAGLLRPLNPFAAQTPGRASQLVLRQMGIATLAYTLDPQSDLVRALVVDPAGQLRDTGQVPAGAGCGASVLAVHPRRPFAYVAGCSLYGSRIDRLELDPASGRVQWTAPHAATPGFAAPLALLIHPELEVAYLAGRTSDVIRSYQIDAQGRLLLDEDETEMPWAPAALAMAGNGRFLYAVSPVQPNIVWWRIGSVDGELQPAGLLRLDEASQLSAVATHPDLPWLYALDASRRLLYQFEVGADGKLRSLHPGTVAAPEGAVALAVSVVP